MMSEEDLDFQTVADEATEVIIAYRRALSIKPVDAQIYFNYGVTFLELGAGLSYAIEAFEAAVRLRPYWAAAHLQLGLAYAAADRREEAVEAYKQALAIRPDDPDTLGALVHACLLLGQYAEAEQATLRMIEAEPLASGPQFILGVVHLLQGHYAAADESLRRAVSLEPDLAEACYAKGLATIALGRDTDVQLQYEKLVELDRRLAGKLNEQRWRGRFEPVVFDCLC